jgi:hypothetical protein
VLEVLLVERVVQNGLGEGGGRRVRWVELRAISKFSVQ